jgi:hypothetical protein
VPADIATLNTAAAARYLGLSKSTLDKARLNGTGCPFVRVTAKCVRYRIEDLDNWLLERRYQSTSAYGQIPHQP